MTVIFSGRVMKDPVCGMLVDEAVSPHRADHLDQTFVFCGSFCEREFVREPARYLAPEYAPSKLRLFGAFLMDRVRSLFGRT
jgi:YHS domain-containing protein